MDTTCILRINFAGTYRFSGTAGQVVTVHVAETGGTLEL